MHPNTPWSFLCCRLVPMRAIVVWETVLIRSTSASITPLSDFYIVWNTIFSQINKGNSYPADCQCSLAPCDVANFRQKCRSHSPVLIFFRSHRNSRSSPHSFAHRLSSTWLSWERVSHDQKSAEPGQRRGTGPVEAVSTVLVSSDTLPWKQAGERQEARISVSPCLFE